MNLEYFCSATTIIAYETARRGNEGEDKERAKLFLKKGAKERH